MRKTPTHPLEPLGSRNKRHDIGTRNPSAMRNARRHLGNPIPIPGNPTREPALSNTIAKMKSSKESNLGTYSNSSSSVTSGRKNRHDTSTSSIKAHIPSTRSSPRTTSSTTSNNKKKTNEIIEIDSDEDHFKSAEEELPPVKKPPRKRRIVQRDCDSDENEEEEYKPIENSNKIPEPSDKDCQRIAMRLARNRAETNQNRLPQELTKRQLADQKHERKMKAEKERMEQEVAEAIKREKDEAIEREKERQQREKERLEKEKEKHQLLHYSNELLKTAPPQNIPSKRARISTPNPFQEKFPAAVSLSESASRTSAYFNLTSTNNHTKSTPIDIPKATPVPTMLESLRSTVKSATQNLFLGRRRLEQKEEDIKSKPIVGDIFSLVDFDKEETSPPTPKLSPPKLSSSRLSSPRAAKQKSQEPMKIELPYDPIDDDPLQPIGSDSHLLTFPFEGKKSVTVYERDLSRLDEDQYLNDTLVDVFPKIWEDDYPTSSTHTFSSFFYTKLAGDGSSVNYDKIGRWTANINIFEKKTIIIPVAQYHHWYLVVVTNPGRCIRNAEAYGLLNEENEVDDNDFVEEDRPPRVGRWKNQVPAGARLNPKKAYIMILDSLAGNKKETCVNTSEYLKKEAMHKLNIQEDEFIEPEFVQAHCPNQKNFVDCGVFCLHFINSLYRDSGRMMKVLYDHQKDDKGWDLENTLPVYRQVLKRILKKKMVKYKEYLTEKLKEEARNV